MDAFHEAVARSQRTVYYAHCQSIYGKPQEERDIKLLESIGLAVISPNTEEIQLRCSRIRAQFIASGNRGSGEYYEDASAQIMYEVFKPLVLRCDILAFRALPSGEIPTGVAREIAWAQEDGAPVFEIPSFALRRVLDVDETRTYLAEVGQR